MQNCTHQQQVCQNLAWQEYDDLKKLALSLNLKNLPTDKYSLCQMISNHYCKENSNDSSKINDSKDYNHVYSKEEYELNSESDQEEDDKQLDHFLQNQHSDLDDILNDK